MKHLPFLSAIRLTVVCLLFFSGFYTLVILGFAQLAPNHGEGESVTINGETTGYLLEGQSFTKDIYFNGRPSAAGYNAAASSGSNKGPSNPDYLKEVQNRIDSFLVHNPGIKKTDIPSDLVTSSGSGLDPDISPAAAYIQTERIAKARGISDKKINALIDSSITKPFIGIAKINVLKINIALDQLK